MGETPTNRAELLRLMADAAWGRERRTPTDAVRATFGYVAVLDGVTAALRAIEAAGCVVVPVEMTREPVAETRERQMPARAA